MELLSPTLTALQDRETHNLLGYACIYGRRLGSNDYFGYEDGSTLVHDPNNQAFHFFTQEGRELGGTLRKAAQVLITGQMEVEDLVHLGSGTFSSTYRLATAESAIAVKISDAEGFLLKENLEKISSADDALAVGDGLKRFGHKKNIQKASLVDTMKLNNTLVREGIRIPKSYGFTIVQKSDSKYWEYQFMEEVKRPTIQQIIDFAYANDTGDESGMSAFAHVDFLDAIADDHFAGDHSLFFRTLVRSYYDFVQTVKGSTFSSQYLRTTTSR